MQNLLKDCWGKNVKNSFVHRRKNQFFNWERKTLGILSISRKIYQLETKMNAKFDNRSWGKNHEICQSILGEKIINLAIPSQENIAKFVNRSCVKKIEKFV